MAHIKIENLKYQYPFAEKLALDGITCEIRPGEFIGVIGRNGSGKSTFCQSLTGLVPNFYRGSYGGKVWIDQSEVKRVEVDDLCQKVGSVFQNPFNQITGSKATVYEEIAFGLENFGVPKEEMEVRIEESLRLLDIEEYRDRAPFDLSGGQMQRMAIASIMAMKPEVIILDEPTSQLDPQGSEAVFKAIQSLSKQGITVIMVEHKVEKIAAYSDRVMLLDQGKLIAMDTPQAVFSRPDLEKYGVVAPTFTRICKQLGMKLPGSSYYPVTLEEASQLLAKNRGGKCMNQISISNLEFSYHPDKKILKGLNIILDERSTAIIGQNGAGKTTFVKLLKGLIRPTAGKIMLNGQDLSEQSVAKIAKSIGLIFQNPDDQIFKHTVLDEIMFGPLQMGMTHSQAEQAARKTMSLLGLDGFDKVNPYDLGLSDRKMVSIAAIVAMDTQVVIFDEPTIAQDDAGKKQIQSVIQLLREQGKIVISILHDMDFVAETFERALVFAQGEVLLDGSVREVFSQKDGLEKAYLSQPTTMQLCQALGYDDVFLTPEEFIAYKQE
ncbi:TPA: ABC transporter ATP-binding protein [Streptococcus suis]